MDLSYQCPFSMHLTCKRPPLKSRDMFSYFFFFVFRGGAGEWVGWVAVDFRGKGCMGKRLFLYLSLSNALHVLWNVLESLI